MIENPALVTAWATVAIAIGIGICGATACLLIWQGLRQMHCSSEEQAKERSERRTADLLGHKRAMQDIRSRHTKPWKTCTPTTPRQ